MQQLALYKLLTDLKCEFLYGIMFTNSDSISFYCIILVREFVIKQMESRLNDDGTGR